MIAEDESDDDPFGRGASGQEDVSGSDEDDAEVGDGEEEAVVDPDDVDVDMDAMEGEDKDINSDEAFGEGDEERFEGFTFRESGKKTSTVKEPKKVGKKRVKVQEQGESNDEDLEMIGASESEDDEPDDGTGASDSDDEDAMSIDGSNSDSEDTGSDSGSESDLSSQPPKEPDTDRATLRRMMAEEQKTVLATISSAQKSDIAKGRAVQHQRRTFDALLNTRIRLQKALVAMNSLSALPPSSQETASPGNLNTTDSEPPSTTSPDPANDTAILAAETAALTLFTTLSSLRHSLHPSTSLPTPTPSTSTPTSQLHAHLSTLDAAALPHHRATLTKWAQKTHLVSSLPSSNRLSAAPTTQPLTSVLDAQLQPPNLDRLVARTRVPRSCAPVQAQSASASAKPHKSISTSTSAETEIVNEHIYDDADFYTLLLRDLVDHKMAHPLHPTSPAAATDGSAGPGAPGIDARGLRREAKVRRAVDPKASKGRKMRYTVQEKLQNFMAREKRGAWGERQVGELFGGLLGRRGGLGEEDGEEDGEGIGDGEWEEGLRLFGGGGWDQGR